MKYRIDIREVFESDEDIALYLRCMANRIDEGIYSDVQLQWDILKVPEEQAK